MIRFLSSAIVSVVCLSVCCSGCSDSDGPDAGSIGRSVGENLTEFAQGVGEGIDTQLQSPLELGPGLVDAGVQHTVAKQGGNPSSSEKTITVYLTSEQPVEGTLVAKAFNENDLEIGRAVTDVQLGTDDAAYFRFDFPGAMDQQTVRRYFIDFRKPSSGLADAVETDE